MRGEMRSRLCWQQDLLRPRAGWPHFDVKGEGPGAKAQHSEWSEASARSQVREVSPQVDRQQSRLRDLGAVAFALALSFQAPASEFNMNYVSPGEMGRLPEYCPHTLAFGGQDLPLWQARLGFTFTHMHHYCWGLLKANRAVAAGVSAQMRSALFSSAVQECYYVLDRAPVDFILRPEILFKAGTFFAETGNLQKALEHFELSKAAKPDYWPPYIEAANLNMRLKRRQHAIDWLKEGLRAMPEERRLIDALARIESAGKASAASAAQAKRQ